MSKEDQNKALAVATRAAKNARKPNPFEDAARGRDPTPIAALPNRPFQRPLAKDRHKTLSHQKPWVKEGMSRASWYRRRAEQKEQKND